MNRVRAFRVLWFGQCASVAGLTVVVPLMPFYLAGLGTSPDEVALWTGAALAAPAATQVVSAPLWGALGDRWGRATMVVRAYLGLAVAVGLMTLAETPGQFLACRILQGACGGVLAATAAYAGTLAPERRRGAALGGLNSATAVGSLLGPLLGGVLAGRLGFGALFVVVALLVLVAAVLAAVVLRDPPGSRDRDAAGGPGEVVATVRTMMRTPGVRAVSMAGLCAQAGVYGLVVVFAARVAEVSDSVPTAIVWVGVLQAVTWAGSAVGSGWWGRRHDRRGATGGFAVGAGGCAVAVALQGLPLTPEALTPVRMVQGLCFAALIPAVLAVTLRLAPSPRTGAVTGVTTAVLDVGQVLGPLLGALLAILLPLPVVFLVLAGLFALAAGLALTVPDGPADPVPDGAPDPVPAPAPPTPEPRR